MPSQTNELLQQMRSDAKKIFQASLEPVNPYNAVRRFVSVEGSKLILGQEDQPQTELDLDQFEHIYLVGGGKATAPMAKAMEDLLGKRFKSGMI